MNKYVAAFNDGQALIVTRHEFDLCKIIHIEHLTQEDECNRFFVLYKDEQGKSDCEWFSEQQFNKYVDFENKEDDLRMKVKETRQLYATKTPLPSMRWSQLNKPAPHERFTATMKHLDAQAKFKEAVDRMARMTIARRGVIDELFYNKSGNPEEFIGLKVTADCIIPKRLEPGDVFVMNGNNEVTEDEQPPPLQSREAAKKAYEKEAALKSYEKEKPKEEKCPLSITKEMFR